MPGRIEVGCCGWREARARYFQQFPAVELQDPFYEMPSPTLAAKWRAEAPPGFRFCLKAWQLITHTPASPTYRRLRSQIAASERTLYGSFRPTEQVRLAWERTTEVARALDAAVVLFQCPASFTATPENVRNFRAFFDDLERGPSMLAWEPRGAWPPALVAELCAACDLLHCVDPFAAESVYGQTVYWRLHGKGQRPVRVRGRRPSVAVRRGAEARRRRSRRLRVVQQSGDGEGRPQIPGYFGDSSSVPSVSSGICSPLFGPISPVLI